MRRDLVAAETREKFCDRILYVRSGALRRAKVLFAVVQQYEAALKSGGADARATLIVGGQIAGQAPELYMVYPEGNYVAATEATPFLQIGEFKYGKPILPRIAGADLSLDDAARLALISFDAAMKSNLSVGPPVELAIYPQGALQFSHRLSLGADSEFLRSFCRGWNEKSEKRFPQAAQIRSGAATATREPLPLNASLPSLKRASWMCSPPCWSAAAHACCAIRWYRSSMRQIRRR